MSLIKYGDAQPINVFESDDLSDELTKDKLTTLKQELANTNESESELVEKDTNVS